MSAFCQPEGEKKGKTDIPGEAEGKWRHRKRAALCAPPPFQVSLLVALQRPRVMICPWLASGQTASAYFFLIPQGLRPEKEKVRKQEALEP